MLTKQLSELTTTGVNYDPGPDEPNSRFGNPEQGWQLHVGPINRVRWVNYSINNGEISCEL